MSNPNQQRFVVVVTYTSHVDFIDRKFDAACSAVSTFLERGSASRIPNCVYVKETR
jgi:uncharacterized protein YsxB (DUF464 family)